jgi:putative component of membrane protein insertase Oxa1/YidC/SpoIIIJ protein YidD
VDIFVSMVGAAARAPKLSQRVDKLFGKLVVFAIRTYQICISSWRKRDCFFNPSCSNWTIENIQRLGLHEGLRASYVHICNCGGSHALRIGPSGRITLVGQNGQEYGEEQLSRYTIGKLRNISHVLPSRDSNGI